MFCPECRLYMGVQDGHGEVETAFRMPHLPDCRLGQRQQAALEAEAEEALRPWGRAR